MPRKLCKRAIASRADFNKKEEVRGYSVLTFTVAVGCFLNT